MVAIGSLKEGINSIQKRYKNSRNLKTSQILSDKNGGNKLSGNTYRNKLQAAGNKNLILLRVDCCCSAYTEHS